EFLKGNFLQSMYMAPTDEFEISDVIANLKNTNSKGYDDIPVNLIKACSMGLRSILSYLNNQSFLDGIFPNALKTAKVIPIFKSEDSNCVSNYRPISVLSTFSKITEKLVYKRLNKYLTDNAILHMNQYGFREKLSTCMALLKLTENISRSIDNGDITIGVFIDLAKAFDTVDHPILLQKLDHYGIRGVVNSWFTSYLTNRNQYVLINKSKSKLSLIKCGVPQGSILGPILFLIYINDLNHVSNILQTIMFADDTNLFLSGKNLQTLEHQLIMELNKVSEWFNTNLLSLNIKKTSYIMFSHRRNLTINIFFANTIINKVDDTKFLGVIISSNLNWNKHIDVITNKISKTTGIIAKVRHLLPSNVTRTLYLILVEPYLNYCNIVWARANSTVNLEKIFKIQKIYVRLITFSAYRAHSAPLFKQLCILSVYQIYKHQLALFMFKKLNNLLPITASFPCLVNSSIHNHFTRCHDQIHLSYCRTRTRQMTVSYQGPSLWNTLPASIRNLKSFYVFKRLVKNCLIQNKI
ncbi:MAG: reverse transcriptase family protein, partial [Oscillospiraceae bacterium]